MSPIQANPDFSLALITAAATLTLVPASSWFLLRKQGRCEVGLWFSGLVAYALAATLLTLADWIPALPLTVAITALPLLAVLLVTEALRRQVGQRPWPTAALVGTTVPYLVLLWGVRQALGPLQAQIAHVTVITMLEAHILALLWRLAKGHPGPGLGLGLALTGVGAIAGANLYRLAQVGMTGEFPLLTSMTFTGNLLFILFSLGVAVAALGYLGFMLEQTEAERQAAGDQATRAQEAQQVSEAFNARLQAVIQERDQMIMASSRFSTLGSLGVLNAGIVHEVSQPLQGLLSYLETLQIAARAGPVPAMGRHLDKARDLALEAAQIVQSLRRMVLAASPAIEPVAVQPLLERLLPIIESEAQQRGVSFTRVEALPPGGAQVRAHPVLLARVVLNLVTNAIEAMDQLPEASAPRQMTLQCGTTDAGSARGPRLILLVTDTGPGAGPAATLLASGTPASTKSEGMGIGLLWVRLLVEQWGGEFTLVDRPAAEGRGAIASCCLPLLPG